MGLDATSLSPGTFHCLLLHEFSSTRYAAATSSVSLCIFPCTFHHRVQKSEKNSEEKKSEVHSHCSVYACAVRSEQTRLVFE